MTTPFDKYAHPAGRILLGLLFAFAGFGKITTLGAAGFGGYIETQMPGMGFLAWPVMLFELLGGIAIFVGFQTRLIAIALAAFCVVTGALYHGVADMNGMLKNIALAGGFLILYAKGAGGFSVDKS
ncbi:membrane protein [Amylibacter ulvae]|uniref:Membrane protein n=1 Tax=Paramylibacter ulvae TaxID=1651968 RepID=A0ABQ3CY31_9RHOB|nr:DoxX family protein [Amylibacter ulvae]GHA42173.1 membrane protein [Amylibacter ulvae]